VPHPSAQPLPVVQFYSLVAEANWLRSPSRRTGPSRHEAEEHALELDAQAAALTEELFWAGWTKITQKSA